MATAFGPDQLSRPAPGPAFDCPTDRLADSMNSLNGPQSLDSQVRGDEPPPNPPFVFPAQPPASASAPSSFSRATGRRPMSAIETPNFSFGLAAENADRQPRSTLPDFSFNPGALLPPDPQTNFLLTPPLSPHSARNIASSQRPGGHGHRRGGSEFVGGRLREGNSIAIMSTSPTKSESGLVTPTFQPPRRGHRRGISGAISTNDLPILQPPVFDAAGRGNSAPTSPTSFGQPGNQVAPLQLDGQIVTEPETVPEPKASEESEEPFISNSPSNGSPKQPKARVGFSDTLEFIPRPLSLVSNETSSTVTARPGHSVSGSISSIVSATSPSGRDSPSPLSQTPTREISDSRPSTAGAILERTPDLANITSSPKRRNSIPTLLNFAEAPKVEDPEPSPTKKRWSFFARESSSGNTSPTKTRPQSSGSLDLLTKTTPWSNHGFDTAGEAPDLAPIKSKSKKSKKKKKKVKGWAGAILPRKPKSHSKRSKSEGGRPPTPPAPSVSRYQGEDEMYGEPELLEASTPTLTVTESPNVPREDETPKRSADESAYPMIDLDAALGPFNTPLPLNPEWEAAQRAANGAGKRRLHSAQGMKGFSGPGMHYHRRAESAPDLPPFDPGRAGMHRYNSNSTMADVFEEDEEDEDDNCRSGTTDESSEEETDSDSDATPPAAVVKDPLRDSQDRLSIHSSTQSVRRTTSSLSDKDQIPSTSVRGERSRSSLHESIIAEELPSVIFRSPFMPAERSDTTDSAPSSLRRFSGNKDLSPVDVSPLHLPAPANVPNSPYAMSYSSSFPSPRSPMSVEVQRISTAPSSVADENNFRSLLLMGEPGPEVRVSVEYDIPSLTSSNSTMTRESMFLPSQRQSQPILREPRPVSVSSAAFGRRRSSLASLSRLISSSHGERSKLSVEVSMDNDENNKKTRSSRTRKLGRMMQFWKPAKEKDGEAK